MHETILMIHGMFGGSWCWDNYRKLFEEKGCHCIIPTLRFHDVSPDELPNPQLGTTSLLDYAGDIEREIRKLDSLPFLMGHSMGGLIAQILGSRGLAKGLILLTPASPGGILALSPSVIKGFRSTLTKWGFWKKPVRQTFDEAVYSMLHLLPVDEQRQAYKKFVYESGKAVFEIGFWPFDPKRATMVDASKVTCPVLLVSGGRDRATPASVNVKIANKYRAVSTYKVFPNNAHWVLWEPGWGKIAAYVSDWMDRVSAAPSQAPVVKTEEPKYVAGKKSNVFHRPDCRQAQRINPEKITKFGTRNEAVKSGRRPCGVCDP
jgi:pimeloyl-ACP methyl ester carboxylesterase